MDATAIKTMFKWLISITKKQVQIFLGLSNYYCPLIVNYKAKALSLINLTKDVLFTWEHS